MLKQQLRAGDVLNERILALFDNISREAFVPEKLQPFAYSDCQLDLGHNERMMTPLEEGLILQALDLNGSETVLEVGTGSGFLTALLAKLAKNVVSIDYYADFIEAARKKLIQHDCDNVELLVGDGRQGLLERAPFDVIVMTGAIEHVDRSLAMQIVEGGKLVVIEGRSPVMVCRLLELDHKGQWHTTFLFDTNIPALINQQKLKEFIF